MLNDIHAEGYWVDVNDAESMKRLRQRFRAVGG